MPLLLEQQQQQQLTKKSSIYYVTLQTEEQLTDSSSKFESIVQQIKQLTREDPTVKIVIFSQWSYILGILEEELTSTKISFRSRLEKFYQTIKEFKVCAVVGEKIAV